MPVLILVLVLVLALVLVLQVVLVLALIVVSMSVISDLSLVTCFFCFPQAGLGLHGKAMLCTHACTRARTHARTNNSGELNHFLVECFSLIHTFLTFSCGSGAHGFCSPSVGRIC